MKILRGYLQNYKISGKLLIEAIFELIVKKCPRIVGV